MENFYSSYSNPEGREDTLRMDHKHLVRFSVILEDTRAAILGVVSKKLGSILTKYLFTMFENSESLLKKEEQIQLSSI